MKRLSRFLAALSVLAAVACGRTDSGPATRTTLLRHLIGDPASLDPTTSTEEPGLMVDALLFRPLVGIDGNRKPIPALASSWTVSPDALTYEFHLDPKYTWETGQPNAQETHEGAVEFEPGVVPDGASYHVPFILFGSPMRFGSCS